MTLEEQIEIIDALPQEDREALGNVCVGFDQSVPADLIRSLMRKGLVVKRQGGRIDVASYWVHYAWCEWCSRHVKEEPV